MRRKVNAFTYWIWRIFCIVPVLLVTCWRPVKFWFRLPVSEGKMTPSVQKPSLKSLKEEIESSQEPAVQNHLSSSV
jgi:hypothetical protein